MGPYGFFILASYGLTAFVVGALILRAVLDHRAQARALADLESRGVRRRSAAPRPTGRPAAEPGPP